VNLVFKVIVEKSGSKGLLFFATTLNLRVATMSHLIPTIPARKRKSFSIASTHSIFGL